MNHQDQVATMYSLLTISSPLQPVKVSPFHGHLARSFPMLGTGGLAVDTTLQTYDNDHPILSNGHKMSITNGLKSLVNPFKEFKIYGNCNDSNMLHVIVFDSLKPFWPDINNSDNMNNNQSRAQQNHQRHHHHKR